MTKAVLFISLVALVALGCGPSGDSSVSSNAPPVEAPTGSGKISGLIEVAAFQGGYGIDFYEQAGKEFEASHPGVTVKVEGDPHIWEQLKPRLMGTTVPDLMFPGWGMDHWALADEGQIMQLNAALDSPAPEGQGTWKDTFEPEILKLGQKDGKQYILPYYFNVQGWWYDPGVFKKHGWTPPKTYDELLTLCEKIKSAGIAPITFQGKYPYYMLEGMYLPWVQSIGGMEVVRDAQNLAPGAWKAAPFLQAAKMIKELNDKGYFQKGAVGMSHTESQTEFLLGHAAMIPCGTWLYSEMKKTMPKDAKMQYMLPPVVSNGAGDPNAVLIGIEPWMIPSHAKNANGAIALFKYMTSLTKAKQFVQEKGTLMAIKESDTEKLPDTLTEAAKAFHGSKTVWAYQARQWYPTLQTELENALTAMLNNEITPEQFCDRAEAAAQSVKKDTGIPKHQI